MNKELKQLTEHCYYYDSKVTRRPLLCCVVGDEQVLFINTGASKMHMKDMLELYDNLGKDPSLSRLGVLTDYHINHSLGLQSCTFPVVSHKITKDLLVEMQSWDFSDSLLTKKAAKNIILNSEVKGLKKEWPIRDDLDIAIPCIIYRHQLELDLGHLPVKLEHIESDHSEDTTIVYIEGDEILFVGDALEPAYDGNVSYYTRQIFNVMETLLNYEAKYYVTSKKHRIFTQNDFFEYCEYLRILGATVSEYGDDLERIEDSLGGISKDDLRFIQQFVEGKKRGNKQ